MCESCGTPLAGVRMEIEFLRRYLRDRESGPDQGEDLEKARELLAFLEQSERRPVE
ncbi:MAG: hypothetical protein V1816_11540 [Pseudomonadota bacterium]